MFTEDVGENFNNFLKECGDRKIYIYGLGGRTKKVIDNIGLDRVSAVVSDIRVGEELYGLNVVDVDTLKEGDILILACYTVSFKIVYDRVQYIEERGIEIYDLSLTNMTKNKNIKYKVKFEQEINIDKELTAVNNIIIDFKNIIGEIIGSKTIYRKYFFELINNCYAQNKTVYIRVDNNFNSEYFKEFGLLDKVKIINENQDITCILSEDATIHFTNEIYSERDNYKIINVPTPIEMLNNSNLSYLTETLKTYGDEVILKLISNRLFYNPFSSDVSIKALEDLGYIAFAPITAKFFDFILKSNLDKDGVILFVSRDGYLVNELYKKYKTIYNNLPDNRYLYVSRRSSIVTSLYTEEDIMNIVNREFRFVIGNFRDRIEQKIGFNLVDAKKLDVDLKTIRTDEQREELVNTVLEYKDLILENSEKERNAYLKYLEKLDIAKYSKKYVYDLYTFGTIFSKMQEYFDDVALLCFAHGKDERLEDKEIISMFGQNTIFYFIRFLKIYLLFEIVYAPNEGQFDKIDENGDPVFRPGTEYNYDKTSQVQQGIVSFIDDFLGITKESDITLEFADSILTLINKSLVPEDIVGNAFDLENKFSAEASKNMWTELMF